MTPRNFALLTIAGVALDAGPGRCLERPKFGYLGMEAAAGPSTTSFRDVSGPVVQTSAAVGGGLFWQLPLVRGPNFALTLGPRVGLLVRPLVDYPIYGDIDLMGGVTLSSGLRFVVGAGATWGSPRHLESYQIEQRVDSHVGPHGFWGVGYEVKRRTTTVFIDGRIEWRLTRHKRIMTDLRTGEQAEFDERATTGAILLALGFYLGL